MECVELVFENGKLLREGDVGIFEIGNDDREAEEDEQEDGSNDEEHGDWLVAEAHHLCGLIESPAPLGEHEHETGGAEPGDGIFDADVGAADVEKDDRDEQKAEAGNDGEQSIHVD